MLFSLAPFQNGQTTRMNFTSTGTWDVLSFALDLTRASVSSSSWLGGWRDAISPTPFLGWHWVDGTNASNLNCGSSGCGVFSSGQPRYSSLSSLARSTLLSSRCRRHVLRDILETLDPFPVHIIWNFTLCCAGSDVRQTVAAIGVTYTSEWMLYDAFLVSNYAPLCQTSWTCMAGSACLSTASPQVRCVGKACTPCEASS